MKRTVFIPNKDRRHSLPPFPKYQSKKQNLTNSLLEQQLLQQQCSNFDSGAYTPN